MKKLSGRDPTCSLHGNVESRRIIRYGFYRTTAGKRRRYRCVGCGQTFSTSKGTPCYRLQHRRTTFDTVVTLLVEGVSLSAIARVEGLARNTVARWLERAAVCRRFSDGRTTGFVATELPSRRDPLVHRGEDPADVGIRGDRGLVASLGCFRNQLLAPSP